MPSSLDMLRMVARLAAIAVWTGITWFCATQVHGQQIEFADQDIQTPILITGERGNSWNQGHYEIWEVEQCMIRHGLFNATSNRAILWIDRATASSRAPHKVIAYLEGPDVEIQRQMILGFEF